MAKVLLINPPKLFIKNSVIKSEVVPPIGLGYMASVLKAGGHSVEVLDAFIEEHDKVTELDKDGISLGMPFEEIGNYTKVFNPDFVGITGLSVWSKAIFRVAEAVRASTKAKIIVGGPFATISPERVLDNKSIDYVVIGEGEETMPELIEALSTGSDIRDIRGIGCRKNKKIFITGPRPFIKELDCIPFPSRDMLMMGDYFSLYKSYRFKKGPRGSRAASIITSRGCPFNCVFCSAHLLLGRAFRARSAENVVDEINELVERYKVNSIYIEDENCTLDKKRWDRICDLILEKNWKLEFFFTQGLRVDTLDETILKKMKKMGCKEITIAPESGSERVLKEVIDKGFTLKKVEEVAKLCKKVGIDFSCFFVIGMPGESKKEIQETLNLARKMRRLGAVSCTVRMALPIIGTRMYKMAKANGYLRYDDNELERLIPLAEMGLFNEHLMETPEWTHEEVEALYRRAQRENQLDMIRAKPYKYVRKVLVGMFLHPKTTEKLIGDIITTIGDKGK